MKNFPDNAFGIAQWPLHMDFDNEIGKYEKFIKNIFSKSIKLSTGRERMLVMDALCRISKDSSTGIYDLVLDNFIYNYISIDCKNKAKPEFDYITDKIVFIFWDLSVLHYWWPILKHLPPCLVDLASIVHYKNDDSVIDKYKLLNYNLYFGLSSLKDYKICLIDVDIWVDYKFLQNKNMFSQRLNAVMKKIIRRKSVVFRLIFAAFRGAPGKNARRRSCENSF